MKKKVSQKVPEEKRVELFVCSPGARRLSKAAAKIGDAMHTVWVRLNAVVFFGLTVIVSLASLTWVSTIGHSGFPAVDVLRVNSVKTLRSHSKKDVAVLTFDLHADLAPAFDWNIKQLFVFVVAEYRSKSNPLNQVVLWDKIIEYPKDANLHMDKATVEYGLIDQGAELRNTTVQLRLAWDHMPLTGRLFMDSVPMSTFQLPGEYTSDKGSNFPANGEGESTTDMVM